MADIDIFSLEPSKISRDLKGKYLLLYGAPKVGKTSFAVQAPRALICAFEMGTNALAGTRSLPMLKWTDFKKVISQLRKPQAKDMYDTIVIDTVSIAYNLCEKYICQRESVDIRDVAWGQGWGMLKNEFQEAFREITMLGFGIIFISHAKEKPTEARDEEGNAISAMAPDLPTAAYTIVNSLVDLIGYIAVEFDTATGMSERYLYTRQTPTIFAGSRYQYLAPKIKFGYNELVNAIDQSVALDGAEVTDHTAQVQVTRRPFQDVMNDARNIWISYLEAAKDNEDKDNRVNILNDIITKIFGKPIKLSQAVPSQQDLVELFIDEAKDLK